MLVLDWDRMRARRAGRAVLAFVALAFSLAATPGRADEAALEQVGAYFNSIRTFTADFVQTTPEGQIGAGWVFLQKPGRLFMQYSEPAPIRVVADGAEIAVINGVDPVQTTPLAGAPISIVLAQDVAAALRASGATAERDGNRIRVSVTRQDPSGEIRITVILRAEPLTVTQWVVTDAQGVANVIALSNVKTNVAVDEGLFVIPQE